MSEQTQTSRSFWDRILVERVVREPVAVVAELRRQGPEATPALCDLLTHREPRYRYAAASALGEVGNERAIQPLAAALQRTFARRSILLDWLIGLPLFLLVLFAYGFVYEHIHHDWDFLTLLLIASNSFVLHRALTLFNRRVNCAHRAIILEALAAIAERTKSPHFDLDWKYVRAAAASPLSLQWSQRTAVRKHLGRLKAALSTMPLPSSAPAEGSLPLTAAAIPSDCRDLPVLVSKGSRR